MEDRDYAGSAGISEASKLEGIAASLDAACAQAETIAANLGDFLERTIGPTPEAVNNVKGPATIRSGGHLGAIEDRLNRLAECMGAAATRAARLSRIG